jgi:apolipoprotein N-acyltransferase
MYQSLREWLRSTFGLAMLGAALLWAALPPLDFAPLAWIAPVFWILLIRAEKLPQYVGASSQTTGKRPTGKPDEPGRPWLLIVAAGLLFGVEMFVTDWFHARKYEFYWAAEIIFWPALFALVCWAARRWAAHPYRCLWLAGMFFWLADLHWLRLPYWAIGFGWLALGIYFGCYFPVFVGLSRVGVHRLRLPVILVAPAVWTGLQLAQAHLLSGMTMGCLEHTQYRWTALIQVSDLTGSYGVTFVMMFVAACIARMLPCGRWRRALWPVLPVAAALATALVYGQWRMSQVLRSDSDPPLKIALVQGNFDVQLPNPEGFRKATQDKYRQLTREALAGYPQTDLIVWPETVFTCINPADGECAPWITGDDDAAIPPGLLDVSPGEFHKRLDNWEQGTCEIMTHAAAEFGRPMVVGVERQNFGPRAVEVFNTAVLVTPDGQWFHQPPARYFYDKTHLVPFGEYMPFARVLPWLQRISPLGSGTSSSDRPACFIVKNVCLVPNICYESTLPHVIREQLAALRQEDVEPQVLVNLTNDGWFWASSELEMHLACGAFRAAENRRPLVIAANTGISALIDGNGHIVAQGPTHDTATILADVQLDGRESWYSRHGDWFAAICLAATIALAAVGIRQSVLRRRA